MSRTQRVALITDGSCGAGLGIAEQLAADGFALAIHGLRDSTEVTEITADLQALRPSRKRLPTATPQADVVYYQADLAVAAQRQRMMDRIRETFGHLDVLVNNAGGAPRGRADLLNVTAASLEQWIDSNLKGPYFLTQSVAKWMVEQRQADSDFTGVIINVASANADLLSIERGDHGIGKAGMAMATKLWAMRLAEYGIQVYEVRPGIFRTDLTETENEKIKLLIAEGLLLEPRWGEPAELGRAIQLLVSGGLSYATGNVLHLDGGLTVPRL